MAILGYASCETGLWEFFKLHKENEDGLILNQQIYVGATMEELMVSLPVINICCYFWGWCEFIEKC